MGCKKKVKTCKIVKRIQAGQKKLRRFARKEQKAMQNVKIKYCKYCEFQTPYQPSLNLHMEMMAGHKGHPKLILVKQGKEKVRVFVNAT
jgi:hypothetical protein